MDEDGIGLVLARATELRFNIGNCIHRATPGQNGPQITQEQGNAEELIEIEEDGEVTLQRLLNVCDALASLESKLSSLQALRQIQQYEREAALADIEYSRKTLLNKLKQYKGKHSEVIQEAVVFASGTAEQSNELFLPPPHANQPPPSSMQDSSESAKKNPADSEVNKKKPTRGTVHIIGTVAKTVVTLVGVVCILRLEGLRQRDAPFRVLNMFLSQLKGDRKSSLPGKAAMVEDGKVQCIVEERIKVPFKSNVSKLLYLSRTEQRSEQNRSWFNVAQRWWYRQMKHKHNDAK